MAKACGWGGSMSWSGAVGLAVTAAGLAWATTGSADTLVSWDLPTSTAASAPVFGSAASGLTVSAITAPGLSQSGVTSSTGWRWASLLNSATVNPAAMTNKAFEWTFTTSPRTTASITQLFQSGTIGTISAEGTGPPTSLQLWAQTGGTAGSWTQVGSSFSTPATATLYSLNAAFVSATAPYNVPAGTTVTFRLVPLGSTGGASSPKSKWTSTNASAADLSLVGTTGGGAWNMYWNGGVSGTWNTTDTSWLQDNTGSPQAFVAGDNAYLPVAVDLVVFGGGISAGSVNVTNSSGTVSLGGGSVSAASLAKSGAGVLVLSASNSFVSGGSVTGGTVVAGHPNALGSTAVTFDGGSLAATTGTVASPLGVGSGGMTVVADAPLLISGTITGASGSRVTKAGADTLTLSGVFGTQTTAPLELDIAAGGLVLSGGQKNVTGTSNWDGPVTLAGATVHLHGGAITGSGTITNTSDTSKFISRLNVGTATVTNAIVTSNTLTIESPNGNNRLTMAGPISGAGGLSLIGNGPKSLDGVNTYAGPTTITAGNLRVNGSITNNSTVTVAAGSQLGGDGLIDSTTTLQAGSTVSLVDGLGASALTFGKGLTVDPTAITQWYLLSNTDLTAAAGSTLGYSQTRVTGGDLTLSSGATINLNFQYTVSGSQASTVLWSDPFWSSSHTWRITDFSGAGTATVANYTISGTTFVDSGTNTLDLATQGSFSITNDGQDVFLVFTAVPEPTTSVALVASGLLALLMSRRRT